MKEAKGLAWPFEDPTPTPLPGDLHSAVANVLRPSELFAAGEGEEAAELVLVAPSRRSLTTHAPVLSKTEVTHDTCCCAHCGALTPIP